MFTVRADDNPETKGKNKGCIGVLVYNDVFDAGRVYDTFYWKSLLLREQEVDLAKLLDYVYEAGMRHGENEFKKSLKEFLTPD